MTTSLLGITFSQQQASWLGLDPYTSLTTCLSWPIVCVRLGSYWSEVEKRPGTYDFTTLRKQIELCQKHHTRVMVTLGVKSPRWPEFYFPSFVHPDINDAKTQHQLYAFIQHTVETFRMYSCITHWQVENEPLNPSGPTKSVIPLEVIQQEAALVRSLDHRPIVLTLWGNDFFHANFSKLESLADVIGLDIYYKQQWWRIFGRNFYKGPIYWDAHIASIIRNSSKPVWITELQAEPWEESAEGFKSNNPRSMSIDQLEKNFYRARRLGAQSIFFWGAEYWLWRAKQGDQRCMDFMKRIPSNHQ